jgi:hypothetical protein
VIEDLSIDDFVLDPSIQDKFLALGLPDQRLISNLEIEAIFNDYKMSQQEEIANNEVIRQQRDHITSLGIKIPDVGELKKYPIKKEVHKHSLYLAEPFNEG